jgi:hypothetical protein
MIWGALKRTWIAELAAWAILLVAVFVAPARFEIASGWLYALLAALAVGVYRVRHGRF